MEIADRVCVVTGGASGIGAACCHAFAALGAHVVVADRNAEGAAAVADKTGGLAFPCDVGDPVQIDALVAAARQRYGRIDVFFSNAGIASGGDPLQVPIRVWQKQWDVNLMAHVHAVRAVLPEMLERGSGYLLHTASMAGILTTPGNAHYAVAKHAVVGLAEWLSIHYHDRGVRTSLLVPLGVNTPMLPPGADRVAGPIREPEEVAQQVIDAMREERFLILTDPIAQTWMERKTADPERWLSGMRRTVARLRSERRAAREGG
jgi:NAD(P)-dependent dehydrogenase (short-subunit alcohol dehydrogenase family)